MAKKCTSGCFPILLLLQIFLVSSFLVTGRSQEAQRSTQQISGILGRSAWFPLNLNPALKVVRIQWKWQQKNETPLLVAEFLRGNFSVVTGRFDPRLELANKTTLRVRDLKMEDSGVYKAHVRFNTNQVEDYTFHLMVYEPVPTPRIVPSLTSRSPEGCNVTLQCQVSGTEGFNISWKRDSGENLEKDQLSNNGRDLHLFLWASSSDSIFTCLASNPIDEKNVSFSLLNICSNESQTWMYYLLVLLLVPVMAAGGLACRIRKKKSRKKSASRAFIKERRTPEAIYENMEEMRLHGGNQRQHHPFNSNMVDVPPPIYDRVTFPQ